MNKTRPLRMRCVDRFRSEEESSDPEVVVAQLLSQFFYGLIGPHKWTLAFSGKSRR